MEWRQMEGGCRELRQRNVSHALDERNYDDALRDSLQGFSLLLLLRFKSPFSLIFDFVPGRQ
jgi:hypothetical protein